MTWQPAGSCEQGIALAGVFRIIINAAGQRTRDGQTQDQIAGQLRPAIETVVMRRYDPECRLLRTDQRTPGSYCQRAT
jgi:hypothetical protein